MKIFGEILLRLKVFGNLLRANFVLEFFNSEIDCRQFSPRGDCGLQCSWHKWFHFHNLILLIILNPAHRQQLHMDSFKSEKIMDLSNGYWAPHTAKSHEAFKSDIIEDIYNNELTGEVVGVRRKIMVLEFSQVRQIFSPILH